MIPEPGFDRSNQRIQVSVKNRRIKLCHHIPLAECTKDAPGAAGALVRMEGKNSGSGGSLVYFSCADCSVEAAKAAMNGGQVFREKFAIGQYGFISLVFDTEGNMIGLHSMQ